MLGLIGSGQKSTRAAAWRPALYIAAWLLVLTLAASAPAAFGWCIGNRSRWQAAVAALFGNFWPLLLLVAATLAALQRLPRLLSLVLAAELLAGALGMVVCVEFAIERGAPLAPIDVVNGLDWGFLRSELPILGSARFAPFLVVFVAVLAYGLYRLQSVLRSPSGARGIGHHLRFAIVIAALCLATVPVRATARGEFGTRPYASLLGAVISANSHNALSGVEEGLLRLQPSEAEVLRGLPMFGLHATRCGNELRVGEPLTAAGAASPKLVGWRNLAQQLRAAGRPLALTFVLMESVGAEDVHGLDASAPAGLTPYLDGLASSKQSVTMSHLFQAGQRTAFAMSALLCGVGTSPGLYAPLRDLPHLNLRCWTNLAHEAGLGGRFFYGEDLSFDHYRDILQEHGFDYLYVANVNGRKRGGWGLSDRELFTDVLADQRTQGEHAGRGVVRGLLTLSTHSPFSVPEDMPEPDEARVRKLARQTTDRTEVIDHWITVSYLDDALARFVPRLMQSDLEQGRTPVVLLVGDHTSGLSISSAPLGAARIPGFWVLPPSLDAGPLSELQRELDERSWSQNDLARFMVELLDGSGQLDSLPPAARWHNVGGQQLANFSAPEPYQDARVWTLDTLARARLLDSSRHVLVEEALQTPRVVEDLRARGIGKDASSALAWLVAHPTSRGLCSL